jgi:hypothetical protein
MKYTTLPILLAILAISTGASAVRAEEMNSSLTSGADVSVSGSGDRGREDERGDDSRNRRDDRREAIKERLDDRRGEMKNRMDDRIEHRGDMIGKRSDMIGLRHSWMSDRLEKIADRIEANLEMLAYAETVDNGKAIIRKLAGPRDIARSGDWIATPF